MKQMLGQGLITPSSFFFGFHKREGEEISHVPSYYKKPNFPLWNHHRLYF